MKEVSGKQASERYGTDESFLDDHNVRVAPLELVIQTQDSELDEEIGHFNYRKGVANAVPARQIHHSQLINEAKNHAVMESEKCCSTLEAKNKFQLVHGNIVGIVGEAGSGKSTLSKILVREILQNDLYDAEYVFYLHFRDLNYSKEMHLLQFLTSDSSFSNHIAEEGLKQVLTKLEENENVYIVLDGFDESLVSEKSKPIKGKCSIYDTVKAETIIKNLLSGNLLPKAKKLFTSRPRQLFQLHKSYRPHFVVNIRGLSGRAQEQVCRDICKNDEACAKVFKFVNARPELKTFCHTPAMCILVMCSIFANFDSGDLSSVEKMDSLTSIFVATLALFTESADRLRGEEFRTKNLSHLAFTTFKLNQLVFQQKDLEDFEISEAEASTFFATRLGKRANMKLIKGKAHTKLYFSHFLLHEFFAALYVILFMDLDAFEEALTDLKDSKYEMMAKFAFGLCNSTTQQYLCDAIPANEFDLFQAQEKIALLKKLALEQVRSAEEFDELSPFCSWAYELRDDEFTNKIVSNMQSKFKVPLNQINGFLPSDAPAYQYTLQRRKTPLDLSVKFGDYERDLWQQFVFVFGGLLQSGKVTVSVYKIISLGLLVFNEGCLAIGQY